MHFYIVYCRYYLVEKAKDANIVGILVGTLGVGMLVLEFHLYVYRFSVIMDDDSWLGI